MHAQRGSLSGTLADLWLREPQKVASVILPAKEKKNPKDIRRDGSSVAFRHQPRESAKKAPMSKIA